MYLWELYITKMSVRQDVTEWEECHRCHTQKNTNKCFTAGVAWKSYTPAWWLQAQELRRQVNQPAPSHTPFWMGYNMHDGLKYHFLSGFWMRHKLPESLWLVALGKTKIELHSASWMNMVFSQHTIQDYTNSAPGSWRNCWHITTKSYGCFEPIVPHARSHLYNHKWAESNICCHFYDFKFIFFPLLFW